MTENIESERLLLVPCSLELATEAVEALIGWAEGQGCVEGFIAHSLTGLTPSIRVLEKCGFSGPFPGPEEGVIRFERNAGT